MAEDMVTLKLASPVSKMQAERMRAKEVKDYPSPGLEITVPRDEARVLINAGYAAGVEPSDAAAVDKALGEPVAAKSATSRTAAKSDKG